MDKTKITLRELIDKFYEKDTPENRINFHHQAEVRKGEIASHIVNILRLEELTIREAISILKDAENLIMHSTVGKTID